MNASNSALGSALNTKYAKVPYNANHCNNIYYNCRKTQRQTIEIYKLLLHSFFMDMYKFNIFMRN